ncbi:arylformamidase [Oceanobacillus luteolus]|uniref:arylformamidase n=1 Tax=Oceanobacillus luteolus TaxID=1274358 RepID=UPI002041DEE9|nr:arylformamidase [Oceanobacillus luteolus]MCM3742297.1 arylformamidase [Oceanobacillus luteolus]
MKEKPWIDVSIPLTNDMGVWPGDKPFNFRLSYTKEQTKSVNIGEMSTSVHTGTHMDAPFHYDNDGKKIHELDVSLFIGPAKVVDVRGHEVIGRKELEAFNLAGVSRLLLRSLDRADSSFPERYPILKEDIGPFLKEKGIHLIGTECPSVDPVDSKHLPAHHALYQNGVYILENLVLKDVKPGLYELIALPLSIHGGDGSPVRAVIREL